MLYLGEMPVPNSCWEAEFFCQASKQVKHLSVFYFLTLTQMGVYAGDSFEVSVFSEKKKSHHLLVVLASAGPRLMGHTAAGMCYSGTVKVFQYR